MFWWDDFWAVVSLACFTIFVPGEPTFIRRLPYTLLRSLQVYSLLPMVHHSRSTLVLPATTWVSLSFWHLKPFTHAPTTVGGFYYCTVWTARLSIIFTVVRIAPWASQKRVMLVVALVIFLQWFLLMVQMFWVCEKGNTAWKDAPFALCPLGLHVAITQAVSEYKFPRLIDYQCLSSPLFFLQPRLSPTSS